MADISHVVVRTFPDRIEAELAQSALEAAGIESRIRTDDGGALYPPLAMTNGISVLVRVEDKAMAEEVLGPR